MSDPQLDRAFQQLHAAAVMILAKSKIEKRPADPYYGYRDLARFVHEGLKEPFDSDHLYLRLLAACKAERSALPTLGHMQALMSLVWGIEVDPRYAHEFAQVCHRISETLCYDVGMFATDSMRALAATLKVDLQVQLGYSEDMHAEQACPVPTSAPVAHQPAAQYQQSPEAKEASGGSKDAEKGTDKPTLH